MGERLVESDWIVNFYVSQHDRMCLGRKDEFRAMQCYFAPKPIMP